MKGQIVLGFMSLAVGKTDNWLGQVRLPTYCCGWWGMISGSLSNRWAPACTSMGDLRVVVKLISGRQAPGIRLHAADSRLIGLYLRW